MSTRHPRTGSPASSYVIILYSYECISNDTLSNQTEWRKAGLHSLHPSMKFCVVMANDHSSCVPRLVAARERHCCNTRFLFCFFLHHNSRRERGRERESKTNSKHVFYWKLFTPNFRHCRGLTIHNIVAQICWSLPNTDRQIDENRSSRPGRP